eukprot:COSAG01_NODE_1460_length_10242_cov_285.193631_2_plen_259_part_00
MARTSTLVGSGSLPGRLHPQCLSLDRNWRAMSKSQSKSPPPSKMEKPRTRPRWLRPCSSAPRAECTYVPSPSRSDADTSDLIGSPWAQLTSGSASGCGTGRDSIYHTHTVPAAPPSRPHPATSAAAAAAHPGSAQLRRLPSVIATLLRRRMIVKLASIVSRWGRLLFDREDRTGRQAGRVHRPTPVNAATPPQKPTGPPTHHRCRAAAAAPAAAAWPASARRAARARRRAVRAPAPRTAGSSRRPGPASPRCPRTARS